MNHFHVIAGYPNTGSTTLCDVFNQNKGNIYASSTSDLSETLAANEQRWSLSPNIKSDSVHDEGMTDERQICVESGMITNWYQHREEDVVIDKGRAWITMSETLHGLSSDSKIIYTHRDPCDAFASMENQDRKFPHRSNFPHTTMMERAKILFSPTGMFGGPIRHAEDHIRRDTKHVIFFEYEKFCENPAAELKKLYIDLEIEWFEHDFENIESTATDCDQLLNGKHKHRYEGTRALVKSKTNWKEDIPADIAKMIREFHPRFGERFGYG